MTAAATPPTRPRMAAPASAVMATTGATSDETISLTQRLKLPHTRRTLTEVIPTAKAQRWQRDRRIIPARYEPRPKARGHPSECGEQSF